MAKIRVSSEIKKNYQALLYIIDRIAESSTLLYRGEPADVMITDLKPSYSYSLKAVVMDVETGSMSKSSTFVIDTLPLVMSILIFFFFSQVIRGGIVNPRKTMA